MSVVAVLLLSLPLANQAEARPGAPDRSFGEGSLAEIRFAPGYRPAIFSSVEALPGDEVRFWEAGSRLQAGYRRYRPGGEVMVEPGGPDIKPLRVVTPDGGAVEIEQTTDTRQEVIRRLLPDGSVDLSFGDDGQEPVPFFGEDEQGPFPTYATSVVPLPSGGLLIGGLSTYRVIIDKSINRQTEVALVRLAPDGKLDSGFGGDGVVKLRTDLGIAMTDLTDATGLPDGDVVVAGERSGSTLEGIDASGAIDTGFGSGGIVTTPGAVTSIDAVPGGFAAAGTVGAGGVGSLAQDLFVSGFSESGAPVGTTRVDLGGAETLQTALWASDGSVVLGGNTVDGPFCISFEICREAPVLSRIAANGEGEAGFRAASNSALERLRAPMHLAGEGGVVSLASRPEGGFYAAGRSGTNPFLAAVDGAGAPIAGFGSDGILRQSYPMPARSSVTALAVDASHRMLVLGEANPDLEWEAEVGYLARYRRDGSPDVGYGEEDGLARLPRGIGTPGAIVALPGDAALVLGEDGIVRIDSSGSPDATFGGDGLVEPVHDHSRSLRLTAIATEPRGSFLVAGTLAKFGPRESVAIYSYRADGSPNRSFGRAGRVVLFGPRRRHFAARALAVQPDGRVLIAGSTSLHPGWNGGGRTASLARLLPDGRLDPAFGRGGWANLPTGLTRLDAVVPTARGIFAGGQSPRGGKVTETLLRLRVDGRPDRAFGRRGAVRRSWRNPTVRGAWDHLSVLLTHRRIVLVSGGAPRPVTGYTLGGRRIRSFDHSLGAVPDRPRRGHPRYGPVAVMQGNQPVLGWTAVVRHGKAGYLSVGWLQRLRAQ